jgi:Zn-finger nucleic acid-binding protein
MELFARRRYYFCAYCGTFEFLESEETEGVSVLAELDPPTPCPACETPLVEGLFNEGQPVLHCRHCRGVLMARRVFADVVTRRRASASGPGSIPAPLDPQELRRVITCPQCKQRMDVHPYYGPGSVVIDTCPRCDAVWLDSGELGQITDAPGGDRRR